MRAATCHAVPQVCACPGGDRLPSCVPALCKQRNHRFLPSPLVLQSAPQGVGSACGAVGTAALCQAQRAAALGAGSAPSWYINAELIAGARFTLLQCYVPTECCWDGAVPSPSWERSGPDPQQSRTVCPALLLSCGARGAGAMGPEMGLSAPYGHGVSAGGTGTRSLCLTKKKSVLFSSHLPAAS